jgi:hypothetical protein
MEPVGSLPHSQVPATCPYPEPAQSSPYPEDPVNYIMATNPVERNSFARVFIISQSAAYWCLKPEGLIFFTFSVWHVDLHLDCKFCPSNVECWNVSKCCCMWLSSNTSWSDSLQEKESFSSTSKTCSWQFCHHGLWCPVDRQCCWFFPRFCTLWCVWGLPCNHTAVVTQRALICVSAILLKVCLFVIMASG